MFLFLGEKERFYFVECSSAEKMANEEDNHRTEWVMISDLAQCMLCYSTVKQPKVLPSCKHLFCFECLLHWWEESVDSNMNSVACPTCRVQCALPTEGISKLPSDIRTSKLGEMLKQCVVIVNKEEKTSTTDSATGPGVATPPCDVCHLDTERDSSSNLSQAIRFCEDCGNHLCDSCSSKHDATSVFARHKVKDLRKARSDSIILCSKHPGRSLQYLCRECPSVACSICVTTQHLGHNVIEMREMIDTRKTEIRNMLQEIRKMSECLDNRMALTEELVMKTKDIYWAVAKKIADHADRCRKEIEDAENHLLEELEAKKAIAIQKTREEGNKRKYNITELDQLREFIEKFLATSEPLEFVTNCEEIFDKMVTILQSRDRGIIVDLQGVGTRFIVQQGLLSLGRLEDESASRMTLEISRKKKPTPVPVPAPPEAPAVESAVKSPCGSSPEQHSKEMVVHENMKGTSSRRARGGEDTRGRQEGQKGRSNSSSTDGDRQLMPHGHPRHARPKVRGRSSSLADRRSGAHDQRRHSIQLERTRRRGEEREGRSRPASMALTKTDALPLLEAREGPKLLWESCTAEKTEAAEPSKPRDVCFDSNGEVYVLNDTHHNLVHFTADGAVNQVISTDFTSPMCVVVTKDGKPAVSDSQEHCIKIFSADGASYSVWDLENIMASGVTIAESGKWLVLDQIGDVFGIFSEPGAKCSQHVPLTKHLLYTERYIACDSKGRVFVSGSEDCAVAVFDPEGHHLMDIGGRGSQGGYVSVPRGLYVDHNDNLIVADRHNHRVTMFSPDGRFIRHVVTCPFDKVVWPTGIDFLRSEKEGFKMAVTISDSLVQVYDVSLVM